MDYAQYDDTIKNWLLNRLSEAEKSNFEAKVLSDEGLKDYVYESRLAFQLLRKARATELEQQFRVWSKDAAPIEKPTSFWQIKPWKVGIAAVFALASAVGAYFWGTNAAQNQIVTLQQRIDSIAAVNQRLQNAPIVQTPSIIDTPKIKETPVIKPNYAQIFAKEYKKTDFGNKMSGTRDSLDSAQLLLISNPKQAEALAQKSLDISEDNPKAWAILAEAEFNQKHYAAAALAFEQLEDYLPIGKDARWNRLICYALLGDKKSFNEQYEKTSKDATPALLQELKKLKSKF
jgi:hypothetical protein